MKRIFWLGMHKVLVQTELPRLRSLGYEVFNPPYLSNVRDQSAELEWSLTEQETTLPKAIAKKLSKHNFFYSELTAGVADILNRYFDAVIVTINPTWLTSVLRSFSGPVIYRTYGSPYCISQELENTGAAALIMNRDDFWYMPHAGETLRFEHNWLCERSKVVPYCVTDDVISLENAWSKETGKKNEIALTCPNIDNPYYAAHYKFLKKHFTNPCFRFYGVQLRQVPEDEQIVGTLSREDQLHALIKSRGYLYTYNEPCVCYLPPVEMSILGGPVVFLEGSLLDRLHPENASGRASSPADAIAKCERLLNHDKPFTDKLIEDSRNVARRYHPDFVWPLFDREIEDALNTPNVRPKWIRPPSLDAQPAQGAHRIYLLHHFPGPSVLFSRGEYSAFDGIPRVMRQVVKALAEDDAVPIEIVITCRQDQLGRMDGFFRSTDATKRNVKLMTVDTKTQAESWGEKLNYAVWRIDLKCQQMIGPRAMRLVDPLRKVAAYMRQLRRSDGDQSGQTTVPEYVRLINQDETTTAVIVPHYYWFPEALAIDRPLALYLPDYMPHLFPEDPQFVELSAEYEQLGKQLAAKATSVFCNSQFTSSYLPDCRLKVEPSKIRVVPLPVLQQPGSVDRARNGGNILGPDLPSKYIFYPTQPRSNKNLALLLRVFDNLADDDHSLALVLTGDPKVDPAAKKALSEMQHANRLKIFSAVSDAELAHLYQSSLVLCFTSNGEGNFPPQILEAMSYETPVVASDLPFVTEHLPDDMRHCLLTARPNDRDDFVSKVRVAISNRQEVVGRQTQLLAFLRESMNFDNFSKSILTQVFHPLLRNRCRPTKR